MNSFLSLCCCLSALVCAAPVPDTFIGPLSDDAEFERTVVGAAALVEKIHSHVHTVHEASVPAESRTVDSSSLQQMAKSLGIPRAPVFQPLSEHFTLETSLQRVGQGLQLHMDLLGALQGRLAPRPVVTELLEVLKELLAKVAKIQQLAGLSAVAPAAPEVSGLASRHLDVYQAQMAAQITLLQLAAFRLDTKRALRNIDAARTRA